MGKANVYISKTNFENPGWDDFKKSAFNLLEGMKFEPPLNKRIVIKPNITIAAEPESGIVTHAGFVHGVVKYLKEKGVIDSNIIIAEGGGQETDRDMPNHWQVSRFEYLANTENISFVNLNLQKVVYLPVPNGVVFEKIGIAELVALEGTFLINIPKMKCHNFAITTLAIKNMMGTIVPVEKRHLCRPIPMENEIAPPVLEELNKFANKLVDLNEARKPDLNIIEGIVGRDGTGFRRGTNYITNFAVAGDDSFAVDTIASYLIGFDPCEIPYLVAARARNLGATKIEQIDTYLLENSELVQVENLDELKYKKKFTVRVRGKNEPPGTIV